MNWREGPAAAGLNVPGSPDVEAITAAALLSIGAWWLGWLAGSRAPPPVVRAIGRGTGAAKC